MLIQGIRLHLNVFTLDYDCRFFLKKNIKPKSLSSNNNKAVLKYAQLNQQMLKSKHKEGIKAWFILPANCESEGNSMLMNVKRVSRVYKEVFEHEYSILLGILR